MNRQPLIVRSGRSPFQVYLMVAAVAIGVVGLAGRRPSKAVEELLPHYSLVAWYIILIVGGTICVVGSYNGSRQTKDQLLLGFAMERIGLWPLGIATSLYVVGVTAVAGWGGFAAGAFPAAFCFACFWRLRQIAIDSVLIQQALTEPHTSDPAPLADPRGH